MDQSSPNPIPSSVLGGADPANAALLATQPEQAQTIALLYEISHELTSILDREELLRRIAERRNIRVVDVRLDPRYVSCGEEVEVRSELVVPLLLRDRLVGVLDLESTKPHAFSAEHERLLNILGSYIAVALENSRLFEDARENQTRLLNDLETAREIQRQLLPSGAKEIPGLDVATAYVPARELGGDFYDLLPYGVGRLAVANGDVSGKGTAAALYGSLAIGILRELVHDNEISPSEM